MADLKPCPFCGSTSIRLNAFGFGQWSAECLCCGIETKRYLGDQITQEGRKRAIEAWNRRTKVEVNIYDKEETYPNCTVQVLTNTATGETSVGWWMNGG